MIPLFVIINRKVYLMRVMEFYRREKKGKRKLVHRTKKKKKEKGRGPLCRLKQFTGSTQFDELQHYLFKVRMSAAQSKQISLLEKISNIKKKSLENITSSRWLAW